jgi:HEAT repeat protein
MAVRSPDAEIRAGALGALGVLGHPGAGQVVAEALEDADWRVRLKAIECVRRVGLTEFFAQVMACADDEVWLVRFRAGQTLMSLAENDVANLKAFVSNVPKRRTEPVATPLPALAPDLGAAIGVAR